MTDQKIRLVVVDNYDSFTFNLVQYFGELGADVVVYRNDEVTIEALEDSNADCMMISPGPCDPPQAGISMAAIRHFAGKMPILGVCLGHQSIGAVYGGRIVRAQQLMHGKTSLMEHTGQGVFAGLPSPYTVNRYHSLSIAREDFPAELLDTLKVDPDRMADAETLDTEVQRLKRQREALGAVNLRAEEDAKATSLTFNEVPLI